MITIKYHFGFNETRKFHELQETNLKNSVKGENIDPIFKNLNWINPLYQGNPLKEISIINKGKHKIEKINDREIMLITITNF